MAGNEGKPAPGGGTVNVQQAVSTAILYFQSLFQQPTIDLAVEEVEKTENDRYWLVTLGYALQRSGFSPMAAGANRSYKAVKIDAQTGEPVSMKIRKL